MQTQPGAPRSIAQTSPQAESNTDVYPTDSHMSQPLDPALSGVMDRILAALDHTDAPLRMGFFAPRAADRSALLDALARTTESRHVRTPEHRKVLGLHLDATTIHEGMQPWHHVVLNTLALMTDGAMPGERATINQLRNELNKLIRLSRRDSVSAAQPAAAFVKHFQTQFPKLVLNAISLANSVLLLVLDRVEEVAPADAAQWLEASQFFYGVPGCAVLLCANEAALVENLGRSAENADGRRLLRAWLTMRVEPKSAPQPEPALESIAKPEHSQAGAGRSVSAIDSPPDIPSSCARVIKDALQPDAAAVAKAFTHWRLAMQALMRRAEEGLGGSIPGALVAKLVALRALAPDLHDAARYDAQMLTALERSAHGETIEMSYTDWDHRMARLPQLKTLFAREPAFSSADLRDLAAALRLSTMDDETAPDDGASTLALRPPRQKSQQAAAAGNRARAAHSLGAAAHTTGQAMARATTSNPFISTSVLTTGFVGAGVFLVDRLAKLFIQSVWQPGGSLLGGLVQPEFLTANSVTGNVYGGGLAVGAELFGLALALLIAVFWGSSRQQKSYSVSLGCIIGAMISNLFDRLAYGAVFNYLHLPNLPVFNLSHAALLVGALLLAYSLLRGPGSGTQPLDNTRAGAHS